MISTIMPKHKSCICMYVLWWCVQHHHITQVFCAWSGSCVSPPCFFFSLLAQLCHSWINTSTCWFLNFRYRGGKGMTYLQSRPCNKPYIKVWWMQLHGHISDSFETSYNNETSKQRGTRGIREGRSCQSQQLEPQHDQTLIEKKYEREKREEWEKIEKRPKGTRKRERTERERVRRSRREKLSQRPGRERQGRKEDR